VGAELLHAYRRTGRQDETDSISQYSERTLKTLPVALLVLLLLNHSAASPSRGAYFVPTLKTISNIIVSLINRNVTSAVVKSDERIKITQEEN
jgi:hypothetical protein